MLFDTALKLQFIFVLYRRPSIIALYSSHAQAPLQWAELPLICPSPHQSHTTHMLDTRR